MTEQSREQEEIQIGLFEEKLLGLGSASLRPIETLTPKDVSYIRESLSRAGLNIENLSDEAKTSLQEPQFRNLDSGKGLGIVAVITISRKPPTFSRGRN